MSQQDRRALQDQHVRDELRKQIELTLKIASTITEWIGAEAINELGAMVDGAENPGIIAARLSKLYSGVTMLLRGLGLAGVAYEGLINRLNEIQAECRAKGDYQRLAVIAHSIEGVLAAHSTGNLAGDVRQALAGRRREPILPSMVGRKLLHHFQKGA